MLVEPHPEQVAKNAVAAGLFEMVANALPINLDAGGIGKYDRAPTTLLDVPYVNGPIAIEVLGRDVPEAAVFAVRRNFTAANTLLLPYEQVLRYFHQRFVADDVFNSGLLTRMVDGYRAPNLAEIDERVSDLFRRSLFAVDGLEPAVAADVEHEYHPSTATDRIGKRFKEHELSFRIKGVDRKSHFRDTYTREEQIEGLRLAQQHPSLVLAILAYQSVLQQYLGALRGTFEAMATESVSIRAGLKDFDKYVEQWGTPNFTHELVPALGIFSRLRAQEFGADRRDSLVDAELFRCAVDFAISNGAFRNWVTVPPDVARDHRERVNHFLCPAVGTVRDQILDGSLLGSLYDAILAKSTAGDGSVLSHLEKIGAEVVRKLAESDGTRTDEEIKRLRERVTMRLRYQARDYTLGLDAPAFERLMRGVPKRNDIVLTPSIGVWLYDLLREAVGISLERKTAVSFYFNGRGYRLTPGRLIDFLRGA